MYSMFDYYIFYKPYQVMSQFSPEANKRTLADFFTSLKKDVYPVGRLDFDSEGLLLLTNDKRLNHRLLHPSFVHKRDYWAQVEGIPTSEALAALMRGVDINVDGKLYRTRPAISACIIEPDKIPERTPPIRYRKSIPTTWLSLVITEGKNRQVRKMTAAVGFPTLRLIRYSIGNVTIDNMQPGDIRKLDSASIKGLFK
jgi:23S rRNA pseudouridine2457 synthase